MKTLVRCKACGYIMEEGHLKDKCPACGVPKTAFEPYNSKVSEKRENFLSLHVHPILVHIPQGIMILYPFFTLAAILFPTGRIKSQLIDITVLLGILMPLFVVIAIITGVIDGKVRFKKLKTPDLLKKIYLGLILLVLTFILSILIISGVTDLLIIFVFSLGFLTLSAFLGRIGSKLTEAKLLG